MFKKIGILMAAFILSACTRLGLEVINLPAAFGGYQQSRDIVFDSNHDLKLDIYAPQDAGEVTYPVLVFLYGGRWTDGRRQDYRFIADRFVPRGYIVVIPDYRKYPDVRFPAFAEDVASSIAWVHDNISAYGGDAASLFVSGHSSGAHLGAIVAADERYLSESVRIKAFAGLAGPYNFTPEEEDLIDMFGPPERYPQMQVSTFVDGSEPPMLFLHGAKDTTVKPFNYERVEAAIREKGGVVESKLYPSFDHVGILTALSWIKDRSDTVAGDIDSFFKMQLDKVEE